jgi:hypothetical protein
MTSPAGKKIFAIHIPWQPSLTAGGTIAALAGHPQIHDSEALAPL